MKLITILFVSAATCVGGQLLSQLLSNPLQIVRRGCDYDVTRDFQLASYDFATRLYKLMGSTNNYHFIVSQNSVWMAMAALAEATTGLAQEELLKVLSLPKEACQRKKYYEIAKMLEKQGNDVKLDRKHYIVFDDQVKVNETWAKAVSEDGLIDVTSTPLGDNQTVKENLQKYLSASPATFPNLNLTGNSVILDSLDYSGLWTTEFPETAIEKNAPFYDDSGKQIGTVDLLRVKKRVKMAYLPIINVKVVELPVGFEGRYRFVMVQNLGKASIERTVQTYMSTIITDMFKYFQESLIPLEIAIPRIDWTHQFDMKFVLENMNITSVWKNEEITKKISQPAALLSDFVQKITMKLDAAGLSKQSESSNPFTSSLSFLAQQVSGLGQKITGATGLPNVLGREFIGNRPFMFALIEPKNSIVLFSGVFSKP